MINEIVAGLETADRWGVKEGQLSLASKMKTPWQLIELFVNLSMMKSVSLMRFQK